MLDINKLRNAYNVIHRMSQTDILLRGGASLRLYRARRYREALNDAAEVIAVYGKI